MHNYDYSARGRPFCAAADVACGLPAAARDSVAALPLSAALAFSHQWLDHVCNTLYPARSQPQLYLHSESWQHTSTTWHRRWLLLHLPSPPFVQVRAQPHVTHSLVTNGGGAHDRCQRKRSGCISEAKAAARRCTAQVKACPGAPVPAGIRLETATKTHQKQIESGIANNECRGAESSRAGWRPPFVTKHRSGGASALRWLGGARPPPDGTPTMRCDSACPAVKGLRSGQGFARA